MADDQTPDRPVPDRTAAPGQGISGRSSDSYGMTWVALAALLFMVLVVGWRLVDFWDGRQPPSGVSTQDATVVGFQDLGASRAGSKSPDYSSVVFELPDGTRASALYELRRLGDHEKGDRITVYRAGGEWRTTAERAWGSTIGWALAMVALLVMIGGWFRVRSRVRSTEPHR
jgi:hypothetical protein